jgi:hypothetical protein
MSLEAGADYVMYVKDGYSLGILDSVEQDDKISYLKQKLESFMGHDSIVVCKKSKSGEKDMDIKPYIYEAAVEDNSRIPSFMDETGVAHADVYEPGIRFFFRLSAGSAVNIKPELVLESFLSYCGESFNELMCQIHRAQMYSDIEQLTGL